MAHQATLKGGNAAASSAMHSAGDPALRRQPHAPVRAEHAAGQVVSNVAGFGENLLNLAELQAQMAAAELRQNVEAVRAAGVVIVTGAVLAIAALPVLLMGAAELLVSELSWRRGYALLGVGLAAVAIAAFCAFAAFVWLRRQRLGFPLSAEEFSRNLNWVHTVLRLSGRRPSQRS